MIQIKNLDGKIIHTVEDDTLRGADLSFKSLKRANFSGMDLKGANIRRSTLKRADFSFADLRETNFERSNLRFANFRGANLEGSSFYLSRMEGTNLKDAILPKFQIPQDVELFGWSLAGGGTWFKIRIPREARRTAELTTNWCRAEFAEVLEIPDESSEITCPFYSVKGPNPSSVRVGDIIYPNKKYHSDIRAETCLSGIMFCLEKF